VKNIVIKYAFLQDMLIPYSSENEFIYLIMGTSHYIQTPLQRTSRSLLKYANCGICVMFGKKSLSSRGEFGFPLVSLTNFSPPVKLLVPKSTKSVAM
jgi:hypothetical protein